MICDNEFFFYAFNQNLRAPPFKIRRDHLYEDAYEKLTNSISLATSNLSVQFINSQGETEPATGTGVTLEFINAFTKQAIQADRKLFVESKHSNKLFPNVKASKYIPNAEEHYFLFGRVIGTCILSRMQIFAPLAKFVIKEILYSKDAAGSSSSKSHQNLISVSDLAEYDKDLFDSLMKLRDADPQDVKNYGLNFTYSLNNKTTINLIKNGHKIPVTKENRLLYIEKVAKLKLTYGMTQQLNALRTGLGSVIPRVVMC